MAALITTPSLIDDPSADRFDFGPAPQHAPTVSGFKFFSPSGSYTAKDSSYWYGTTGNDMVRPTGGGGVYVGGPGDDMMSAPNNGLVSDHLYGDNLTKGFPGKTIGKYGQFGNDFLEFGARDHVKSGEGEDTYAFHHLATVKTAAHTWMNLKKDHLLVANEPEIVAVKFAWVDTKTKTASVSNMTLLNDAQSGPMKGTQAIIQHFDPENENLDTGSWIIKWTGKTADLYDVNQAWDAHIASHPDFLL